MRKFWTFRYFSPPRATAYCPRPWSLPLFYNPFDAESCLSLRLSSIELRGSAQGIEDSPAMQALAEHHALWTRELPESGEDLWAWRLGQNTATRLGLLA
jgi:hypothetical protein